MWPFDTFEFDTLDLYDEYLIYFFLQSLKLKFEMSYK